MNTLQQKQDEFNYDQPWYLEDGTEVVLLEKCKHGFIVEMIYDTDPNQEPAYSEPKWVEKIFKSENVVRLLPEIERRKNELNELSKNIQEKREECRKVEDDYREIMRKFSYIDELRYIERFISGEIEYMVVMDKNGRGIPEVVKFDVDSMDRANYRKVVLTIGINKHLTWSAVRTGQFNWKPDIRLFCDRESAVAFAADEIYKQWKHGRPNTRECYEALCDIKVAIPMEIQQQYEMITQAEEEGKRNRLLEEIENKKKELEKLAQN